MIDNKTGVLQLPLPSPTNKLSDDIGRLIQSLTMIDTALSSQGITISTLNDALNSQGTTISTLNDALNSQGTTISTLNTEVADLASLPMQFGYKSTIRYPSGTFLFVDGNWYECYHPDGCLGKDPRLATNRPGAWANSDPAAPYYWLKHGKFLCHGTVGTIEMWETATLPENRIKRLNSPLNASKFWRLAEVHANYVSNGNIILPDDVRGQFPRFQGATTGADENRQINTLQGDAMRNLTGRVPGFFLHSLGQNHHAGATGVFELLTWSHSNIALASGGGSGFTFDASRQVPVAVEFRPQNTSKLAVIPI